MRKTITVVAVLVDLAVIGVGASRYLNQGTDSPAPRPTEQAAPPPQQQPDWCPRVEFISAPGTWESAADDDPLNPSAQSALVHAVYYEAIAGGLRGGREGMDPSLYRAV